MIAEQRQAPRNRHLDEIRNPRRVWRCCSPVGRSWKCRAAQGRAALRPAGVRRGRGNRDWPPPSLSRRLASLVLGCDWTLWHWPQFFMQDSYIAGAFPIGSAVFWVGWVLPTVLYTWIYNLTGRMILSAILLHFMVNFWGELLSVRGEMVVYRSVWTVVVVIAIVLIWGPKTLRGRRGGA
jgi:hypothetical protein